MGVSVLHFAPLQYQHAWWHLGGPPPELAQPPTVCSKGNLGHPLKTISAGVHSASVFYRKQPCLNVAAKPASGPCWKQPSRWVMGKGKSLYTQHTRTCVALCTSPGTVGSFLLRISGAQVTPAPPALLCLHCAPLQCSLESFSRVPCSVVLGTMMPRGLVRA